MVGVILISENNEGAEMLKTVRRLLGKIKGVKALALKQKFSAQNMQEMIHETIDSLGADEGLLLLTNLFGSTQCNVCKKFIKKGKIEILTGFNLPLILKLASLNNLMSFKNLVGLAEEYGRSHLLHIDSLGAYQKMCQKKAIS